MTPGKGKCPQQRKQHHLASPCLEKSIIAFPSAKSMGPRSGIKYVTRTIRPQKPSTLHPVRGERGVELKEASEIRVRRDEKLLIHRAASAWKSGHSLEKHDGSVSAIVLGDAHVCCTSKNVGTRTQLARFRILEEHSSKNLAMNIFPVGVFHIPLKLSRKSGPTVAAWSRN
ncbi:imidazole glycerol phosphate synthase subunit HisF [Anopheles sinensis]|uniref:Imidazole glycerol phosphate synthase subunit HisF n=1 Tax=Anopheles sinensis TaxID=74873 RepID=A0A084VLJ8_ANOSI|nr:imidazole glycerol phosphate synthase subunit HisF [Anopheles sinensis]